MFYLNVSIVIRLIILAMEKIVEIRKFQFEILKGMIIIYFWEVRNPFKGMIELFLENR